MRHTCFYLILLLSLLPLTSGCATHTSLPKETRHTIALEFHGATVELQQSLYFGDLYDENEMWLLSPYPFENTSHIVDHQLSLIHISEPTRPY